MNAPLHVINPVVLETEVKSLYRRVALAPQSEFNFEVGRALAERLGYSERWLDRVPAEANASFAGVGQHFHLADLKPGERVVDLGSGSGMDAFVAATQVGSNGRVIGVEMTEAQRQKARRLRDERGEDFDMVDFLGGRIERLPLEDATVDCVISNGAISLVVDKEEVFREAFRVLKPGGRLSISDIVSVAELPPSVVSNATLWAECIAGAMPREEYQEVLQAAGFTLLYVQPNREYQFPEGRAHRSARQYQVQSFSLLATKT
jgi:SAM-dependent methyltransferase